MKFAMSFMEAKHHSNYNLYYLFIIFVSYPSITFVSNLLLFVDYVNFLSEVTGIIVKYIIKE